MSKVIIIIGDVRYESVKSEDTLGKCKGCHFLEECATQECHCGFIGKAMEDQHFVRIENQSGG